MKNSKPPVITYLYNDHDLENERKEKRERILASISNTFLKIGTNIAKIFLTIWPVMLIVTLVSLLVWFIVFLCTPATKEYEISNARWETSINIYQYVKSEQKHFGALNAIPQDAYNIRENYAKTHADEDDLTVAGQPNYYYSINRWETIDTLRNSGTSKEVIEPTCEYPTSSPEYLGAIKRQSGYDVVYKVDASNGSTYKLDAVSWNKLMNIDSDAPLKISCKKRPLSSKITEMQILGTDISMNE